MLVLVSYDVAVSSTGGKRRLRKVAKQCQNYGQRVQYSVFECVVDPAQWTKLKNSLESIIDKEEDSLRFYYLGANYKRRVEHIGAKPSRDVDEPLIV
jgi:CRISPR-associated protein Cas2